MHTLVSDWIFSFRTAFHDLIDSYHPYSKVTARNLFEECAMQHLSDPNDSVKILLLGCGDLRDALATVSDRARKSDMLQIHLNDNSPSIMARNLLFLAIIDEKDFDIEKQEHFDFLWNVWFNAKWEKPTAKRFMKIVQRLLDGYLPPNVFVSQGHNALKEVLKNWLALMNSDGCMPSDLMKKISSKQEKPIHAAWQLEQQNPIESLFGKLLEIRDTSSTSVPFRVAASGITSRIGALLGDGPFSPHVPENTNWNRVKEEILDYFEHGHCCIRKPKKYVTFNPTFLDPSSAAWHVNYGLTPFEGFFCLIDNKKLQEDISKEGVQHKISLLSVCQEIFKQQILNYKNSRPAELHFHVRNSLEFCFDTSLKFDLIDCSFLSDKFGLANILLAIRSRLSDHPDALAITTSEDWMMLDSTVSDYVQASLGVPLSMIPTIYGFKLASNVEFGEPTQTLPHVAKMVYATLIWRRCPDWENVVLTPSPTIRKCFTELYHRSFRPEDFIAPAMDDVSSFTPLTYHLIANSLVQRYGLNPTEVDFNETISFTIPRHFQLHYRTFSAWAAGSQSLKRFTSVEFKVTESGMLILESCHTLTPKARLILLPGALLQESLPPNFEESGDVHFIDSFSCGRNDDKRGNRELYFSFITASNDGLDASLHAIIYDVHLNKVLFYVGQLKDMRQEPFKQPYPLTFNKKSNAPRRGAAEMSEYMETEDALMFAINFKSSVVSPTIQIETDSEFPCEAAHSCKIVAKTVDGSRSFALKVPHAFSSDRVFHSLMEFESNTESDSLVTLTVSEGSTAGSNIIGFSLSKATAEPWVHDFRRKPSDRIDPGSLKPYPDNDVNGLLLHLENESDSPLNLLQTLIRQIYLAALYSEDAEKLVVVRDHADTSKNYWFIRIHEPIRIDPNGVPFLSLTVQDHLLLDKLIWNAKKISSQTVSKEYDKIFPHPYFHAVSLETIEQSQQFRHLLRLNSTKVLLNSWQKKNLAPSNQGISWMATFLTPVYESRIHMLRKIYNLKRTGIDRKPDCSPPPQCLAPVTQTARKTCANCAKELDKNIKVCSRCKVVRYCERTCQVADWAKHKLTCKAPVKS